MESKLNIQRVTQAIAYHLSTKCVCSLPDDFYRAWLTLVRSPNVSWAKLTANWSPDQKETLMTCIQLICENMTNRSNNERAHICSKIFDLHNALTRVENDLIDYIIGVADAGRSNSNLSYYAASQAFASWFLTARSLMDKRWLDRIIDYIDSSQMCDIPGALEILGCIIEEKYLSEHLLKDGVSNNCHNILTMIPEQLNNTQLKLLCIRTSETKWPHIVDRFVTSINSDSDVHCANIIAFLNLWEAIIATNTNVSMRTTPFYYLIEELFKLSTNYISPLVYKPMLNFLTSSINRNFHLYNIIGPISPPILKSFENKYRDCMF